LISNFSWVLNVVFFILGDFPDVLILYADVSEHSLFYLHRWCTQEEHSSCVHHLWRWNSVPKRRHIQFRRRGNHPK